MDRFLGGWGIVLLGLILLAYIEASKEFHVTDFEKMQQQPLRERFNQETERRRQQRLRHEERRCQPYDASGVTKHDK